LLYGEQGAGKGFLFDNLIKKYIYGDYCSVQEGLEKITQRFNSVMQDKLLMVCNEVNSNENWHCVFDKLKALITDPTMSIERKGIDLVEDYPNYANFIMTTNNHDAVKLGKGDRRYCCIETASTFKGDFDYFDRLAEACTPENAREFFEMCKSRPITRCIRKIPMTKLKEEMLQHCITSPERFMRDLEDYVDDLDTEKLSAVHVNDSQWGTTLRGCCLIGKGELRIVQSKVYPVYIQYCTENKETSKKRHEFIRMFEEKYGQVKKSHGDKIYVLKYGIKCGVEVEFTLPKQPVLKRSKDTDGLETVEVHRIEFDGDCEVPLKPLMRRR
jgi:phage/plasmid-associated DNA primase